MNLSNTTDISIISHSTDAIYVTANYSSLTIAECKIRQYFTNVEDFLYCYQYFYSQQWAVSTFGVFLSIGTMICNFMVMILMTLNSERITKFDQIIFGHSMVGLIAQEFFKYILFGLFNLNALKNIKC